MSNSDFPISFSRLRINVLVQSENIGKNDCKILLLNDGVSNRLSCFQNFALKIWIVLKMDRFN